jgi:dCMP deaminase
MSALPQGVTTRPDWDDYFMHIAYSVARRGDCRRRQVGCVLVDADHRIIGTGYNGAEPGGPSCLAGECPRGLSEAPRTEDYSNCVAVHAEANALLFARASCRGATAYVSSAICDGCMKLLRGAGLARVVYVGPLGEGIHLTIWSGKP